MPSKPPALPQRRAAESGEEPEDKIRLAHAAMPGPEIRALVAHGGGARLEYHNLERSILSAPYTQLSKIRNIILNDSTREPISTLSDLALSDVT